MNRGVLQSAPAPAPPMMAAGAPSLWSLNNIRPPPLHQPLSTFFSPPPYLFSQFNIPASSSFSSSFFSSASSSWPDNQEQFAQSWSQPFLDEGDKAPPPPPPADGLHSYRANSKCKKMENSGEDVVLHHHHHKAHQSHVNHHHVKQENSSASSYVNHGRVDQHQTTRNNLPKSSSPHDSCVTTFSTDVLDFSTTAKPDVRHPPPPPPAGSSSEANSTANGSGGALKKARVQPSSTQSTLKVRKEKMGDRIIALHQLVSPFGKTDTASVLLEAIGYIRFLQRQVEALSLPYLTSGSQKKRQTQPGCDDEPEEDLRSRGLCLVPLSCTLHVENDNGADYWTPAQGSRY
ncbi:hypothetical protein Nepgr_019878 [Nepenthes gracilis]|uniref:BHLH domain-containing protein n=1 Tax=Nepenthes gracilis TaxID=150966 RepID=A0AAD3SW29_NEPGR|nr:hypothetical protein Nepgr_019878 [Nepenthes gracilis]